MIQGKNDVSDVFSIFHDGIVSQWQRKDAGIRLTIEIEYLANLVSPGYDKFILDVCDIERATFETWPSDLKSESLLLDSLDDIFAAELEILESKVEGNRIVVVCNQHSQAYDYCGGELSFAAESARVLDQAGKNYSLEELDTICKNYWNRWEKDNRNARGEE